MRHTRQTYIVYILGGLSLAFLIFYIAFGLKSDAPPKDFSEQKTEFNQMEMKRDIEKLAEVDPSFAPVRAFFVDLANKKGGVYSFEILKQAPLPPNVDTHLLGHAVGDELYKQTGLDGMKYCTHDLRNACSHTIVIGALLERGLEIFDEVNDVCKEAPGGPGAYTMCFHGFGHGVLAYADYEFPDAVKLCGKVGTAEYGNEEVSQCIGGMVMEMFQGIHDPEVWLQKKEKYLSIDDPLRLCKTDYMPEQAKVLCYSYITPFIFESAGAVNGNPTPDIYKNSFEYCDEVEAGPNRNSCYGGLGKEFIVLAQERDIRKIEDTPTDRLMLAQSWCMLAEKSEAQSACTASLLDSLFWGGENDPEVSIRFCTNISLDGMKSGCFDHLFQIASYYTRDTDDRAAICSAVPSAYTKKCEEILVR